MTQDVFAEYACPTPSAPEQAEEVAAEAFAEGTLLFRAGNYAPALERFQCSFDLFPHPSTLYNIGECHEALEDYPEAVRVYRRYVNTIADLEGREEVESHIRELEDRIPPGQRSQPEPTPEPAVEGLSEGLTEQQPEPEPELDLEPSSETLASSIETNEEESTTSRRRLKPAAFWATFGATATTALIMTITGAVTLSLSNSWIEEGQVEDRDTGRTLRAVTDVFFFTTLAEAIATVVLGVFTDFRGNRANAGEANNE
jgi:tetratricopeptide (TPR) repeat protein